jgi:amino acid adenylation domain-containing protein
MIASLLDTGALPELPLAEDQRLLAIARALSRAEDYDLLCSLVSQVEQTHSPDGIAVREAGRTLTYRELATHARRIASMLAELGADEGSIIAVGGQRGADIIATFLAVELIGAAYLPVDHTWPALRIQNVLERSGATALLTSGTACQPLDEAAEAASCRFAQVADAAGLPLWDGTPQPRPDQVRYVLYTSGSTGAPKGAVVEHQGMMNHLLTKVHDLKITEVDRIAQTAPLVFDISLWQMLAPLLAGAEVHVLSDEEAHSPTGLMAAVARQAITVLEVVPTVLRLLLHEAEHGAALETPLRWVLATGEELPPKIARRFTQLWPTVGLLNAYGPTECSDDVTHFTVGMPDLDVRHLPIGGPIANTALYVLRRDGDQWVSCKTGEVGELFVGGAGVGRGYLGDPERTRDVFFRDPFASTPTGRLYRTGDAVVTLPEGILEYRGRVDRQVKIAGFRMELTEIEAVLRRHPAVAVCAVAVLQSDEQGTLVARETKLSSSSGHQLIAYLCPSGEDVDQVAVRNHLAERLPLPMVPQRYVVLPELPLTPNGKVDYAALSTPSATACATSYTPPRGVAEQAVAMAMAELLGVQRLGRDESFVARGGDSLVAIRLIARLRDLGYHITMRDVLLGGTPEGVAARLTAQVKEDGEPHHLSTVDKLKVRRRPLTPQQSGVFFHWKLAPDNPYYSYQGSLRLTGPLDGDRLVVAWRALLKENAALLSRFLNDDSGPAHEYPHWNVELPGLTDLTSLSVAEREEHYRAEAFAAAAEPFDLLNAPALRVQWFRLGLEEYRLLITMHEILLDGWGATVLFQRLAELYEEPTALGDPERYDRYLDWQQRILVGPGLNQAREYWYRQLSGELPVLTLPSAESRRPSPTYRGEIVEELVDATITVRIRELSGRLGGTPFMVFLGAYALALGYYTGAEEIMIGAPIANREHAEQVDVAAFMINMLPLRIRLAPEMTGHDYLTAVKNTVVDGYAASAFPFGWMLRDLPDIVRCTTSTPIFQTMLNLLTYPSRPVRARGVTFAFTELDTGFTKYDCSLYVQIHTFDTLLVQLAHHIDVVTKDTAQRLLESTLLALDALTRNPDARLSDIDLIPVTDHAFLEEFSHGH